MAEAFGVAGSAFGTVSLGLQLFKEVSQYLDDIDGREEDLKEARSYATNIQLSLNALSVAISTAPADDPKTQRAIESCKASCVSAVDNLLAVVKELRGPTISLPNSNASRAKELCAKLKYPFKKQTMEKLEDNLSRAGILGFGQTMAWVATVDERLSPAFQLVDKIARYSSLPRKEMDILLASCFRRLVCCYANSYASATDVNEDGETILGWALDKYANLYVLDSTMADNMAELFQMLNVIAEPTSCSRNIVAPIPILIGISSWFFAYGRKILIQGLAERRERLKELSYQCLSPAERNGLGIHQTRILDHNAARVQQQLEAQGCSVPTHLSVYEEVVGPLCGYESIYLLIFNGELAEFAHKLGFSYSDNDLADLMCRLASRLNDGTYATDMLIDNLFPSSYFCWMIDHGMRVASKVSSGKLLNRQLEATAAHYFMASYGRFAGISLNIPLDCPLSLAAIEIVFSAAVVDRCRCWCSPGGCTPVVKLLEEVWRRRWSPGKQSLSKATERLIYDLVSANCGKTSEYQWIHAAIIRYFTFSMLGLRHVCCSIIGNESGALPEEEFQEIEEEDSSLLRQFENLLTESEDGRRHQMGLEEFFKWMDTKWAPRMKEVRAELASERLTDEQLRGAESIGVVWRVYGPQPEGKAWQPARWERRDVWDYMDELDKIATDPERPRKESRQSHK
ncbi:hypothetical protein FGLOB1_8886 [Fusarium globosum]|uniref:Fungal N-terminal domain-containing protein n=1 Tax=Fusarium globosum TaxID=78864 RepID=A0A8H6D4P6_9HYPO|nr:hypothetical protein FGLOB1_8886 [Fusarium globosum]